MLICVLLLALGAVALVCYVREKIRAYSVRAVLLKSVVSTLFLALGVCGWYAAPAGKAVFGVFTVLGLALGLLGDVWLDLKYVHPDQALPYTYAGFAAFGAGHVLYISGLLAQFYLPGSAWALIAPYALAALACGAVLLAEKPLKLSFGRMKPVVAVYSFLLFSTLFTAGAMALLHGWKCVTLNVFFIGSVLFTLSDLVLSGTYFGRGHERPVDLICNYCLYYGGQFLIAFSLAFLAA